MNIKQFFKISALLIVPASLITGCLGLLDTVATNKYQNYQQVVSEGAFDQGWIPEFLPTSAFNILEKYDLDTNEIILKFSFDINESTNLTQNCNPVAQVLPPRLLKADWWSNELVISSQNRFYCDETEGYMVVDEDTVYYWKPSS